MIRRRDVWPLGAIAFVLGVSAGWWAFALWSLPGAPDWFERARAVCFNITESGLPDAKGWLLLIGQPPAMLATLYVGWRDEVRDTLQHLVGVTSGRILIAATLLASLGGLGLAGVKVRDAGLPEVTLEDEAVVPDTYPRLDRPWPVASGLVDQSGATFDLARLEGRGAFVTFAFGHCATVCPMVVHAARSARQELGLDLPIVVLTLDPWRDTPSRLPSLVAQFELEANRDFVVSGTVPDVEAALDGWNIPRQRDEVTGDVAHPALTYLIESDGTVAYGVTGGVSQLVALGKRLR